MVQLRSKISWFFGKKNTKKSWVKFSLLFTNVEDRTCIHLVVPSLLLHDSRIRVRLNNYFDFYLLPTLFFLIWYNNTFASTNLTIPLNDSVWRESLNSKLAYLQGGLEFILFGVRNMWIFPLIKFPYNLKISKHRYWDLLEKQSRGFGKFSSDNRIKEKIFLDREKKNFCNENIEIFGEAFTNAR